MSTPNEALAARLTSLAGRTGIVTGQSGGLGIAISRVLADAGATIYGLNRTVRPEAEHPGVTQVRVDITDAGATAAAVQRIGDAGGIDFVINNAGITVKDRAENISPAQFRSVQTVNVDAMFDLSARAFPFLSASPHVGRIVNIASMAAHLGFSQVVPYAASKAAVGGLTRGLAIEWAQHNVLVNSVSPGWFRTQMNEAVTATDPERTAKILARIPLGHYGEAENIADMVLFLLSDASTYITGQDFAVDGGALAQGF